MQSIRSFFKNRLESLGTYPVAYLCALGIAIAGIMINHETTLGIDHDMSNVLVRIILSGLFVIPLALTAPLLVQIRKSSFQPYVGWGQISAFVLGVAHFLSLPIDMDTAFTAQQQWTLLSIIFAWTIPLFAIALANKHKQDNVRSRSWQFLTKLAIAGVSAAIVGGGVAVSIVSVEYLFDLQVYSNVYQDIWICAFALVGSSIWLVSLCGTDDEEANYMRLLRFFGLYIFLPLAILYACILLLYALQIAITQELPRGIVTWMIVGYTCFGLIGYLFTYKLRSGLGRVKTAHQRYFISLLVFVLLLAVAIGVRVNEYGLTPPRYLIIMFGVWMITISIVSLISSKYSLTSIVGALVVLLGLSTFGPQNAVNLPTYCQYQKLVKLLDTNGLLVDGHAQALTVRVDASRPNAMSGEIQRIYDTVDYLSEQRGPHVFKPLFADGQFEQLTGATRRTTTQQFMTALGIDNASPKAIGYLDNDYINYYYNGIATAGDISDYSYIIPLGFGNDITPVNGMSINMVDGEKGKLNINVGNKQYDINMYDHLDTIRAAAKQRQEAGPALEIVTDTYKIVLHEFGARRVTGDTYTIENYGGYILLK